MDNTCYIERSKVREILICAVTDDKDGWRLDLILQKIDVLPISTAEDFRYANPDARDAAFRRIRQNIRSDVSAACWDGIKAYEAAIATGPDLQATISRLTAERDGLRKALGAALWYIDASDRELKDAKETREDALLKFREAAYATTPTESDALAGGEG